MTFRAEDEARTVPGADVKLAMYRQMVLIRRFDDRLLDLAPAGEIEGAVHPYTGQEAIAVGVCSLLRQTDRITSNHRGHGHCIAKGAQTDRMMAELYGRATGYCRGQGGSMHIADFDVGMLGANGIVGAGLPIADGSALAAKLQSSDTVTVSFFSDGAAGAGSIHESLNISALWQLPVIWLCENNQWQSGQPIEATIVLKDIHPMAGSYGIPHELVDGNDVLAVREAAGRAIDRARAGAGPTFLEARTYRMNIHSRSPRAKAPDNRSEELLAPWRARDPIALFERALREEGVLDNDKVGAIEQSVLDEIEAAIAFAKASPFPDPQDALKTLFAE